MPFHRDNPPIERLDRQEEMRRVRDEIERQQEEKQQPRGDKGDHWCQNRHH